MKLEGFLKEVKKLRIKVEYPSPVLVLKGWIETLKRRYEFGIYEMEEVFHYYIEYTDRNNWKEKKVLEGKGNLSILLGTLKKMKESNPFGKELTKREQVLQWARISEIVNAYKYLQEKVIKLDRTTMKEKYARLLEESLEGFVNEMDEMF